MQKLILLIDDDQDEFFILDQAIQEAGLPVTCMWADRPDKAWRLLSHILPDLILIDYNMPALNGIQCLEKIRQMNKLADVPVMIYSNALNEKITRQAHEMGASCLQKGAVDHAVHSLSDFLDYRKVLLAAG